MTRPLGTTTTKHTIDIASKRLFTLSGYEGFTMRTLSKQSGVSLSSMYHFYKDKDDLLHSLYHQANKSLGDERAKLATPKTASEMLLQRITFQFEHAEDIVFVLKYYLHFRSTFPKRTDGYLPPKAALHVEEVLARGVETGEYKLDDAEIASEAKMVAHTINGFLLEYYPEQLEDTELGVLCADIHDFVTRAITAKGAPAK
jgi:AcrR family transcriptional regulator